MGKLFLSLVLCVCFFNVSHAKQPQKKAAGIVKIFSQKVKFQITDDWKVAHHKVTDVDYLLDFVLKSESKDNFTNMFAVIGLKNMALLDLPMDSYAEVFFKPYKQGCEKNFIVENLGETTTSGFKTGRYLTTCLKASKNTNTGLKKGQSEVIYTTFVKGKNDIYLIKRMLRAGPIKQEAKYWNMHNAELFMLDFSPLSLCSLKGKAQECIE